MYGLKIHCLTSIDAGGFNGRIHCTRHAVDRGWQTCQISLLYWWLLHGSGLNLIEPGELVYTQGPFAHRLIGAVGNPLWCFVIHSSEFRALIKQRLAKRQSTARYFKIPRYFQIFQAIQRYSKAAITIYVDIVNLFIFLLELFGDRRRWTIYRTVGLVDKLLPRSTKTDIMWSAHRTGSKKVWKPCAHVVTIILESLGLIGINATCQSLPIYQEDTLEP